jgi:hypothetical protein
VGAVPAPAARLVAEAPAPAPPASIRQSDQPVPAFDREALIDDVVDRLRRDARLDRERLGLVLGDVL